MWLCLLVMKWACILRIIVRVGCHVQIAARQHVLSWCERRLAMYFGIGNKWVSFGSEANMHLVNPRHGLCVTCTVLGAIMFCNDANSCLRFTFEVATKWLSFLVSRWTCAHVYGLGTKHTLVRAGSLGRVASRCLRLTFGCATKCLSLFMMTWTFIQCE